MIEYTKLREFTDGIFIAWLIDNEPVHWSGAVEERQGWWLNWAPKQRDRYSRNAFMRGTIYFIDNPKRMWLSGEHDELPLVTLSTNGVPSVDGIGIADQLVLEKMVTRARKIRVSDYANQAAPLVVGPRKVRL